MWERGGLRTSGPDRGPRREAVRHTDFGTGATGEGTIFRLNPDRTGFSPTTTRPWCATRPPRNPRVSATVNRKEVRRMKKTIWTVLSLVLAGALFPLVSHAGINHNETLVRDTAK